MPSKAKPNGVKIGFFSRIDFGSEGFRLGLIKLATEKFVEEKVDFVVLAGGLVLEKALKIELKDRLRGKNKDDRDAITYAYYRECVDYLADHIPHIKSPDPDKKWCTIYVVTSPAYDGDVMGQEIVYRLARRRPDIKHWGHGEGIFPTKQEGRDICVLTPRKAAWLRGDYFSTPVERTIKDYLKRTTNNPPALVVVGCFGSDIQKPKGESRVPYISVPVLHKLYETRTGSENQVGITVVDYKQGNGSPLTRTYSFSDILANERSFIASPSGATRRQVAIVNTVKDKKASTVGLIAHELKLRNRSKIQKDLDVLVSNSAQGNWPGLIFDSGSHKYDFDPEWLRDKLSFNYPNGDYKEDSLMAFACLHAGCVYTDYRFFVDVLPKLIIDSNTNILIGAGDFIEGLKHNLILREVYGGLDYTLQEEFAAWLVSRVILRVFKARFDMLVSQRSRVNENMVRQWVSDSLLTFLYISGNHCQWTIDSGVHALRTFRCELFELVFNGVKKVMGEHKISISDLGTLVGNKIVEGSKYELPNTKVALEIFHPHMSRTKTTSIRPQEMLAFAKDNTALVVGGNFHVAESVGEWAPVTGQRKCLQVGTIKWTSGYEANKLKIVDKGSGFVRIRTRNSRIIMTEVAFYGSVDPEKPLSNKDILLSLEQKLEKSD